MLGMHASCQEDGRIDSPLFGASTGEVGKGQPDLLLDGCIGGEVAARDGVCRFGLGVAKGA